MMIEREKVFKETIRLIWAYDRNDRFDDSCELLMMLERLGIIDGDFSLELIDMLGDKDTHRMVEAYRSRYENE